MSSRERRPPKKVRQHRRPQRRPKKPVVSLGVASEVTEEPKEHPEATVAMIEATGAEVSVVDSVESQLHVVDIATNLATQRCPNTTTAKGSTPWTTPIMLTIASCLPVRTLHIISRTFTRPRSTLTTARRCPRCARLNMRRCSVKDRPRNSTTGVTTATMSKHQWKGAVVAVIVAIAVTEGIVVVVVDRILLTIDSRNHKVVEKIGKIRFVK